MKNRIFRTRKQILDDYVREQQLEDSKKRFDMYNRIAENGLISKEDLNSYILSEKILSVVVKKPVDKFSLIIWN